MATVSSNDLLPPVAKELISFFLLIGSPATCFFYWISYEYFSASLTSTARSLYAEGLFDFVAARTPSVRTWHFSIYFAWILFQAALYYILPGPIHYGPRTPGGRKLPYKLNGFVAWLFTVGLACVAHFTGTIDLGIIASNWGSLLLVANLYCALLIFAFRVKARTHLDDPGETIFTGLFWSDLFNGGELHPRTGLFFDWKHFNASRTGGILLWTLIDISFAIRQYQMYGLVTNSMIMSLAFRLLVVGEYFWYENWFLETLDNTHERFSFYSIYGFAGMMPHLWTLQSQYLVLHPVQLSPINATAVFAMFAAGWTLRHIADGQKSLTKEKNGYCTIWGENAKVLQVKYTTWDGKTHSTVLLYSGLWGVVRHANYVGSVLYTWASCLACGTGHIFPYAEAVIMTIMVIHRCRRDETRCRLKYGESWLDYCQRVPWRMIPYVY